MNILAVITARGGSKRIPRKNIKDFMGKPMISYAINAAQVAGIFDEIMVSTDDLEIAEIARYYGAKVPFLRSEQTANDYATTCDVLEEVLNNYAQADRHFDYLCCIYPCSPFLTGDILRSAFDRFLTTRADRLVPVVRYAFPIQRAFKINTEGYLEYREPENAMKRSQDLEPMYHDVGMFYFFKTNKLRSMISAMFEMEDACAQDIDTEEDWKSAEMKFKIQKSIL